jgi:tetratricopeptide (TPR) repeat protein
MLPEEFLSKIADEYGLSEAQREVFTAKFRDDRNDRDLADTLYISDASIRARMTEVYKKFSFEGGKGPGKHVKLLNLLNSKYQKYLGQSANSESDSSSSQGVNLDMSNSTRGKLGDSQALLKSQQELNSSSEQNTHDSTEQAWSEIDVALETKNIVQLEDGIKHFLELEDSPQTQRGWEPFFNYLRYKCGVLDALQRLNRLKEEPEITYLSYYWLGMCYQNSNNWEQAVEEFTGAAHHAPKPETRASRMVDVSECLSEQGKNEEARELLMQELSIIDNSEAVARIYKGLAQLYPQNRVIQALALEKALEIKSNDEDLMFSTAFHYNESGMKYLSALHYDRLIQFNQKRSMAMNNLGVLYSDLDMPMTGAALYEKAVQLDETLAAANLAYKYMNAGFLEKALDVLDKARRQEEVHPNVWAAMNELHRRKDKEKERKESIFQSAREQQQFFRAFAQAYFHTKNESPQCFEGKWTAFNPHLGNTLISICCENNWITASLIEDDTEKKMFEGHVSNYAAIINFRISDALGSTHSGESEYLYLSDNQKVMFILCTNHSIVELIRLDEN